VTPTITITATKTLTRTATVTATPIPNLVLVGPGGGTTFVPPNITIPAGQTVTWQWAPGIGPHSVTSGVCDTNICSPGPVGGPPPINFDSGFITGAPVTGTTFSQTFPNNGVYTYFCKVHGVMMQGTVNVL
jgi:plastocyanin